MVIGYLFLKLQTPIEHTFDKKEQFSDIANLKIVVDKLVNKMDKHKNNTIFINSIDDSPQVLSDLLIDSALSFSSRSLFLFLHHRWSINFPFFNSWKLRNLDNLDNLDYQTT